MHGNWIPIILFLSLAFVCLGYLFFHYQNKNKLQDTLQLAIEKEQVLSPEIIEKLLNKSNPQADLKRGIILISTGVAIALFGVISTDVERGFAAFAIFPTMIGIGYLLVWKLKPKEVVDSE
jgi:hypothetical protein